MVVKKGKLEISKYLMYVGLILAVLTLMNLFVSDIYPESKKCEQILEPLYSMLEPGAPAEFGVSVAQMQDNEAISLLILQCNNVQNDLFISYGLIAIGVAFLVGGLITIKERELYGKDKD